MSKNEADEAINYYLLNLNQQHDDLSMDVREEAYRINSGYYLSISECFNIMQASDEPDNPFLRVDKAVTRYFNRNNAVRSANSRQNTQKHRMTRVNHGLHPEFKKPPDNDQVSLLDGLDVDETIDSVLLSPENPEVEEINPFQLLFEENVPLDDAFMGLAKNPPMDHQPENLNKTEFTFSYPNFPDTDALSTIANYSPSDSRSFGSDYSNLNSSQENQTNFTNCTMQDQNVPRQGTNLNSSRANNLNSPQENRTITNFPYWVTVGGRNIKVDGTNFNSSPENNTNMTNFTSWATAGPNTKIAGHNLKSFQGNNLNSTQINNANSLNSTNFTNWTTPGNNNRKIPDNNFNSSGTIGNYSPGLNSTSNTTNLIDKSNTKIAGHNLNSFQGNNLKSTQINNANSSNSTNFTNWTTPGNNNTKIPDNNFNSSGTIGNYSPGLNSTSNTTNLIDKSSSNLTQNLIPETSQTLFDNRLNKTKISSRLETVTSKNLTQDLTDNNTSPNLNSPRFNNDPPDLSPLSNCLPVADKSTPIDTDLNSSQPDNSSRNLSKDNLTTDSNCKPPNCTIETNLNSSEDNNSSRNIPPVDVRGLAKFLLTTPKKLNINKFRMEQLAQESKQETETTLDECKSTEDESNRKETNLNSSMDDNLSRNLNNNCLTPDKTTELDSSFNSSPDDDTPLKYLIKKNLSSIIDGPDVKTTSRDDNSNQENVSTVANCAKVANTTSTKQSNLNSSRTRKTRSQSLEHYSLDGSDGASVRNLRSVLRSSIKEAESESGPIKRGRITKNKLGVDKPRKKCVKKLVL